MKVCPTCNRTIYPVFKVSDSIIVNSNVDNVYAYWIGKVGTVTEENDDNSFTVKIENDEICIYDHEMDKVEQ